MSAPKTFLQNMDVYLLDLDGTLYLGDEILPGAHALMNYLNTHKKFLYVTNNSSRNKAHYEQRLQKLGFPVTKEQIYSSVDATIAYFKKHLPHVHKIYLLGNHDLAAELKEAGFELVTEAKEAQEIILGFDTELTYQKLWQACDRIQELGRYYATHPDIVCPLAGGKVMPDAGAMMKLIEAVTHISPKVIGKPEETMIEGIELKYGYKREKMVMIGDRLYTDIKMGEVAGCRTILVLSGETNQEDYDMASIQADLVVKNVGEIVKWIFDSSCKRSV